MEQMQDDIRQKITRLISEKNYIGAYTLARAEKDLQTEYAGTIAQAVVDELGSLPSRGNRERVYYLRSILLWIFRDVPGLAPMYRSQVREGIFADSSPDMLKMLYQFAAASTRTVPRTADEAAEGVKETFDTVVDDITSGRADEKMRSFMDAAGEGLAAGLRGMSDFMDALAGSSGGKNPDGGQESGE
ncbi:MAG: hypothetical protein JXB03_05390 [Spirochaetales bacterium]|nr:hypothetical protein [Spirochaetales bacterium]